MVMKLPALLPLLGSNAKTRSGRKKCSGAANESMRGAGTSGIRGGGFGGFFAVFDFLFPARFFGVKFFTRGTFPLQDDSRTNLTVWGSQERPDAYAKFCSAGSADSEHPCWLGDFRLQNGGEISRLRQITQSIASTTCGIRRVFHRNNCCTSCK